MSVQDPNSVSQAGFEKIEMRFSKLAVFLFSLPTCTRTIHLSDKATILIIHIFLHV